MTSASAIDSSASAATKTRMIPKKIASAFTTVAAETTISIRRARCGRLGPRHGATAACVRVACSPWEDPPPRSRLRRASAASPASTRCTSAAPDDRLLRQRERRRREQERAGLRPAEPAVERDQLLERAALVQDRVVEAADHDVGDVREAVRPPQVAGGGGRERCERVLALDAPLVEVRGARRAEHDGAVGRGAHEQPADVRMRSQRAEQLGMALVDVLQREPAIALHEVDEPEVAGSEDHDLALRDVGLRALGRLARRSPPRRRGAPSHPARRRPRSRPRRRPRATARRARRARSRGAA